MVSSRPLDSWSSVVEGFRAEHVALTTRSREEAAIRLSSQLSPHQIKLLGKDKAFDARFLSAQ
jgi:hypothetical protein